MKRIISTLAGLTMALSLATTTAHAGTVLTASNTEFAIVDDLVKYTGYFFKPPEVWPYCEMDYLGFSGCARRVVTLGPGRIEDVNITVDLSVQLFPDEMALFLSHAGVHLALIPYAGWGCGAGPFAATNGAIKYDDEAANPFPCPADPPHPPGTYQPFYPGSLAAFDGLDAAGEWVLTLADCCAGDARRFYSMTLEVTVPEPATLALLGLALAGLGFSRRRKLH